MSKCENGLYVCPTCGCVNGGTMVGDYVHDCVSCSCNGFCELSRTTNMPKYERFCTQCLIGHIESFNGKPGPGKAHSDRN